jgi:hypothetical protein
MPLFDDVNGNENPPLLIGYAAVNKLVVGSPLKQFISYGS